MKIALQFKCSLCEETRYTMRLCIDYRSLNDKTIDDRHPLLHIQESLDPLGGNSWFSVLDQGKAYHQGFISEGSHHLTAFISLWGLYQWIWVPFVLKNAPAYFQGTMKNILGEYHDKIVIPYMDDLIVFSKSFEEHLEHLKLVLHRLREHGVKLKEYKCNFFTCKVKFLGTIVSEHGYQMDPDNIKAVHFFLKR